METRTIQVFNQELKNKLLFYKSHFGKRLLNMAKNNHTPDREQKEPEGSQRPCIECNGSGRVRSDSEDEDNQDETEVCPGCKGEGWVDTDDWENEW